MAAPDKQKSKTIEEDLPVCCIRRCGKPVVAKDAVACAKHAGKNLQCLRCKKSFLRASMQNDMCGKCFDIAQCSKKGGMYPIGKSGAEIAQQFPRYQKSKENFKADDSDGEDDEDLQDQYKEFLGTTQHKRRMDELESLHQNSRARKKKRVDEKTAEDIPIPEEEGDVEGEEEYDFSKKLDKIPRAEIAVIPSTKST